MTKPDVLSHPFHCNYFKHTFVFLAVSLLLFSCASIDEKMQRHIQEGKYTEAIQAGETFISKKAGTPEAQAVFDLLMEAEFKQAQALNTIEAYDAYQHKFPHHPYKNELIEAEFQLYKAMNTIDGYDAFHKKFSKHSFTSELVEAEFLLYKGQNTIEAYDAFNGKFPDHPFKTELIEAEFTLYKEKNTLEGFDEFHGKFPDHPFKDELIRAEYGLYSQMDTVEGYEAFEKKFPDHPFKDDLLERKSVVYYKTVTVPKGSAAAFKEFIARFPASSLVSEAKEKENLAAYAEGEAAWKTAVEAHTIQSYEAFCTACPESHHLAEAREKICELAWKEAETANTIDACLKFKNEHNACITQVKLAESKAEDMAWKETVGKNTPEAYKQFCETYPASLHVSEAQTAEVSLKKNLVLRVSAMTPIKTSVVKPITSKIIDNATFVDSYSDDSEKFKLKNGKYEERWNSFFIEDKAIGDLNGDGVDDAAVIASFSGGGSGSFLSLYFAVASLKKIIFIKSDDLGDRSVVKSFSIKSGKIYLTILVRGPRDAFCCPSLAQSKVYEMKNGKLVESK